VPLRCRRRSRRRRYRRQRHGSRSRCGSPSCGSRCRRFYHRRAGKWAWRCLPGGQPHSVQPGRSRWSPDLRVPPRGTAQRREFPPPKSADQRSVTGYGRDRSSGWIGCPNYCRQRAGSGQGSHGGTRQHHQRGLIRHQPPDPRWRHTGARAG
jgi:hypothetical protein